MNAAAHHEDARVGGRTASRRAARHEHVPRVAMTFARTQTACHRPGEVDASPTATWHEDVIRKEFPLQVSVSAGELLPARHAEPGDEPGARARRSAEKGESGSVFLYARDGRAFFDSAVFSRDCLVT